MGRCEIPTRKRRPRLLFFVLCAILCHINSVKGVVICMYNVCTFQPFACSNGGTCRYNRDCLVECDCPPDFTGERCENANTSCSDTCSPETCNRQGVCFQDPATCKFRCNCFDGYGGDACKVIVPRKEPDVHHCFPLICVHGECDRTQENVVRCNCEDQWTGSTCNIAL